MAARGYNLDGPSRPFAALAQEKGMVFLMGQVPSEKIRDQIGHLVDFLIREAFSQHIHETIIR